MYCFCNNNPTVGQFLHSLKTNIFNGLAFSGLCESNCEGGGAALLDNLQLLLKAPDASSSILSASHSNETPDVSESSHVSQKVQEVIGASEHVGDMELFSVACQWFHCHICAS
jgi:hypothetical protein